MTIFRELIETTLRCHDLFITERQKEQIVATMNALYPDRSAILCAASRLLRLMGRRPFYLGTERIEV